METAARYETKVILKNIGERVGNGANTLNDVRVLRKEAAISTNHRFVRLSYESRSGKCACMFYLTSTTLYIEGVRDARMQRGGTPIHVYVSGDGTQSNRINTYCLNFRAQMFGGRKRTINNRPVIEAVLHDPTRVDAVFECVKDDDAYVRMRASDALEKVCRANASIVQPLQTRVLNEMSAIDQPSVQWHYAHIVDQLHFTPQETAQAMSKLKTQF